jgi:hypothetical protein
MIRFQSIRTKILERAGTAIVPPAIPRVVYSTTTSFQASYAASTGQMSAQVQEVSAAAQELRQMASDLHQVAGQFKV